MVLNIEAALVRTGLSLIELYVLQFAWGEVLCLGQAQDCSRP